MSSGLPRGERAVVRIKHDSEQDWADVEDQDYATVEVFDHVTVSTHHYVNSVNGYDTFEPAVTEGDMSSGPRPDAVTLRVARLLSAEFGIDVEDLGIEVIDIQDDDVAVP